MFKTLINFDIQTFCLVTTEYQSMKCFLLLDRLRERPGIPACSHILRSPAPHILKKQVSTNWYTPLTFTIINITLWLKTGYLIKTLLLKEMKENGVRWIKMLFIKLYLSTLSLLKRKIHVQYIRYLKFWTLLLFIYWNVEFFIITHTIVLFNIIKNKET